MKRLYTCLAVAAVAALPAAASAGSATAASSVSLTVQGNCSITNSGGAGNFAFPTVTSGSSGLQTATGTLAYNCSTGTTPALAFNDAASTGTANFTLTAGASTINYSLCLTSKFTGTGSGSCSSPILNSTTSSFAPPSGASIALDAYFSYSNSLAAGTYADTVTATLTF